MKQPVVVVGIGEMGRVFAGGFLAAAHPVYPVNRSTPMAEIAAAVPDPALVLITVGEDDLDPVLAELPDVWRSRVGLIQNELLPRDWEAHGIGNPTVASVWFEKKAGRPITVIVPTLVAGPAAPLVAEALGAIDVAADVIPTAELTGALVAKNLYILVANIVGMRTGGTVSGVWDGNRDLAEAAAAEILDIQEALVGGPIDRDGAIAAMVSAFAADPDHGATGRSAPRRLERALGHAAAAGLDTPVLLSIAEPS